MNVESAIRLHKTRPLDHADAGLIDGRYKLGELMGEGGEGAVYSAHDLVARRDVALKLVSSDGLVLGEEFLVARNMVHPNIVRVLDVGRCDDGGQYFTMELLDAGTLRDVFGRWGVEGLLQVATGCARALEHVHGRGRIHGDLKPSNILVAETTQGVEARLIDFGMSVAAEGSLCGTPAYMAPELTLGKPSGPASDLYALGVSLYESIAGQNPFQADTTAETIERHRALQPPPLDGVPDLLSSAIMRLINKDPAARHSSARAFLHAISEVSSGVLSTALGQSSPLPERGGTFVGRRDEIEVLSGMLPPESGGAVLFRGARGVGKSRLLEEAVARARLRGVRVVHLDCGKLRGQMSALREMARVVSLGSADDREGLRALIWTTLDSFNGQPDLGTIAMAIQKLAEILTRSPTMLALDDVDQIDEGSGGWLRELFALVRARTLIVGTTRYLAPSVHELLVEGGDARDRVLEPLSKPEIHEMVGGALGVSERSLRAAGLLYESSGGNPGKLQRLMTVHAESGGFQWREGRWVLDPRFLARTPSEVCQNVRFYEAPPLTEATPRELMLLSLAAVFGESFDVTLLERLAEAPRSGEIEDLVGQGWIEPLVDRAGAYRFVSSALRQACGSRLEEDDWRKHHARAADLLKTYKPEAFECIAEHLYESGEVSKARGMMKRAAKQAESKGQPGQAARMLRRVLAWIPSRAEQCCFHEQIADLEIKGGRFDVAAEHYRAVIGLCGESGAALRKLGWVLSESGQYKEAMPLLERALDAQTASAPNNTEEMMEARFALGWTAMMGGDYKRATAEAEAGLALSEGAESAVAARLHRLAGTIGWHQGDALSACRSFERGASMARRAGDRCAEADCLMGLGTGLRMRGRSAQSIREYRKAIRINKELGRLIKLAKCLNGLGIVQYISGDWVQAARSWEQFRDTCVATGDVPDLVMAHNNLGFLCKDRGELERAVAELERGLEVARGAGFTRGQAMVLGNLGEVLTLQERFVEARQRLIESIQLAGEIGSDDELLEGRRRMVELTAAEGDPEGALIQITGVIAEARRQNNKGEEGILLRVRGEALREIGRAGEGFSLLEQARALLSEHGGRLDLARAELALVRAQLDRSPEDVRKLAEQARERVSEIGAQHLIDESEALLTEIRQRDWETNHSLVHLLEVARDVSSVLDLDRLLEVIADRALEVTGTSRALIILFEDGSEVKVHTARWREQDLRDELAMRISRTIADKVYRENRSVIVTDVLSDHELSEQASIRSMKLQSVMCVPMSWKGEMVGILYVDSQQKSINFHEEDLKVVEALASQAAVAIQNARMFEMERRRREMISHMAHDFRTPLTALQITLEMIAREAPGLDDELRDLLAATRNQVRGLDRMTSMVVNLEKLKQGRVPVNPERLALSEELLGLLQSLTPLAKERGLALVWKLGEIPPVFADPDAVTRIVTNIVGNAVKALPRGGLICVETTLIDPSDQSHGEVDAESVGWSPARPDGDSGWVKVRIEDNGPGLPEAQRERLMMVERSADSSSGFGLAIVRELVHRHGGRIWCEAPPSGGTAFCFTLPVDAGP